MKKTLLKVCAVMLCLFASESVFAQSKDVNLLYSKTSVIPDAQVGYASPTKNGTAPSGAKAVIVSAEDNGGDIAYRLRVELSEPIQIRGVSKVHIEWEPLDENLKASQRCNMIFSIFTLNKDDNAAFRKKTLDYANRGEDKKSIFWVDGEQPFSAVYDLSADCQTWTDTTYDGSSKRITGFEVYVNVGSGANGDSPANFKGLAVTNIWFD